MKIARHGEKNAAPERWAEHAGLFAERIADRNNLAGDRRSQRGFGGGAESAGDGFVESGSEQRWADSGLGFGPGQCFYAFAEGGKRVGEAVVAVDAGNFFDEIDFALEVEAPAWQAHMPYECLGGVGEEFASETCECGFDERRGNAFLVFRLAENAVDFAERERNGLAIGSAGFPCRHMPVYQVALDIAAVGKQD